MDIKKNDITPDDNETAEEVVFNVQKGKESNTSEEQKVSPDKKPEQPEENNEVISDEAAVFGSAADEQETEDEEEIVFASSPEKNTVKRHATAQIKQAKKFPKVPVIIGSAAVICVAVSGIIFASTFNRNTAPTLTETSAEPSQGSAVSAAAKPQTEEPSVLPVIRTDPADIKTINTATIVFGDNVTVEGVSLSGKTLSEAYDAMQNRLSELRDKISISITCDSKNITLTEDDFSFDTDLPDVLVQAYHYSRGELDTPTVNTVYNDGKTDFTVTSVINSDSIGGAVKKVSDKFDIQPVDAHVTSFEPTQTEKFTYADGSDGFLIDQNDVRSQIEEILLRSAKTGAFSIEAKRTPFKVTLAEVKANTKLIASSYTTAANVWASNQNMKLAIRSANGTIVNPGEIFSFNTMTGDTTTGELGYVPSTAIVKGKYEQQYGGGICQASTTLFLCALKADMEIIERHAHQYASNYADRGLDATVDYGNLDMRFKNNKDFPIYIATYVYDYDGDGLEELMVEMYGQLSTEYDEIVPVGWVTYAGSETYSAKGAKVYFKNGSEVKREYLPIGTYDYHGDSYSYAASLIPSDPEYGPQSVSPTNRIPTVFSPGGCGSNAPIPYGTAAEYLKQAATPSVTEVSKIDTASSNPEN
ncbi:MAG: VanW family protein [Clostridia bacterium]|nr:VanW family protein [Clostridia bacterium]